MRDPVRLSPVAPATPGLLSPVTRNLFFYMGPPIRVSVLKAHISTLASYTQRALGSGDADGLLFPLLGGAGTWRPVTGLSWPAALL
jgi:hypothetical protein